VVTGLVSLVDRAKEDFSSRSFFVSQLLDSNSCGTRVTNAVTITNEPTIESIA